MRFGTRWVSAAMVVAALVAGRAMAAELPSKTELPQGQRGPGVPEFQVRAGYKVTLAADNIPDCRFLEFDEHGTLYVSQPGPGTILALREAGDGTYQQVGKFVSGKKTVHGMHYADGYLWFTTSGAIFKAKVKPDGTAPDEILTVIPEGKLPSGGHWWRSILVDKDGFFTSIGDSGNINDETKTDRQKIWRYDLEGKERKLWSAGLRNTEKLRFRPGTTELWGCDHGSDNFGKSYGEKGGDQPITDALPGDELNRYVEGGFYGHPFIVGNNIPRPEYAKRPDIVELAGKAIPPAYLFGAHWANNGFTFLTKDTFAGHKGDMFVAFHGSWNSTKKVGYRIQRVLFDEQTGLPYGGLQIVGCLSPEGRVLGRPVDCAEAPDGTVLFSVDGGKGRIYRIGPAK